jgi:phosphoenolpyruvate carboxylase
MRLTRLALSLLLVLGVVAPSQPAEGHPVRANNRRPDALAAQLGLGSPTQRQRLAATLVLTEHPSSLRLLRHQLRDLKQALSTSLKAAEPSAILERLQRPYMTGAKHLREFRRYAVDLGLASAKMIDFEGKPMDPGLIPRHVAVLERAGLRPGLAGDRLILVRLPANAEQSGKDLSLRERVMQSIVSTNLTRVMASKPLPVDQIILPQVVSPADLPRVHEEYERAAQQALDQAVRSGRLAPADRAKTFERLAPIQVVPLVESADAVAGSAKIAESYLGYYRSRFGRLPAHALVFLAGSDLNREVGPVAGQLLRSVARSRLARLQQRMPEVDLVPWIGVGSGPMRSGVGRFPELASALHPGMTFTVQPDQLDQRNRKAVLAAFGQAALSARAERLDPKGEENRVALAVAFADVHAALTTRNALPSIRIANLLAPLNQRGRKGALGKLLYERDGELYLRSPGDQQPQGYAPAPAPTLPTGPMNGTAYGRSLELVGLASELKAAHQRERASVERRQAIIDRFWPQGIPDSRAIAGAFARYVEGHSLTTVAGLGRALEQAEALHGRAATESLRPLIRFLVQNDGFVLTRDRSLVRRRIRVLLPNFTRAEVEQWTQRYFDDLALLERYLARPAQDGTPGVRRLEDLIETKHRTRYERASRRLYRNAAFVRYLRGEDLRLDDWVRVMDDLIPLLANPGWNRIG